jgi:hypothetical protein
VCICGYATISAHVTSDQSETDLSRFAN